MIFYPQYFTNMQIITPTTPQLSHNWQLWDFGKKHTGIPQLHFTSPEGKCSCGSVIAER